MVSGWRRESVKVAQPVGVLSSGHNFLGSEFMPFGQVVIGPPGSGKSTYCYGLHQFYTALSRPVLVVNLDPAAPNPPYPCALSISSLISLADAMDTFSLGPNGAMLYCLEYLEKNIAWLEEELENALVQGGWEGKRSEAYVVFDTPGQVELSTDHGSLKRIIEHLQKKGWRLAAVHLMDSHHITDASKYVALLLLSLRTMLQLELPHVNVLSKVDLLANAGDLPFNLEYYTEVQDLQRLIPALEADPLTRRFSALNQIICDLIEEFGLVSFETLCVEDKESMLRLTQVIDQAIGYVAPHHNLSPTDEDDPLDSDHHNHHHEHAHDHLPNLATEKLYYTQTVQEKWVDHQDVYKDFERGRWKEEGDRAIETANAEKRPPPGVAQEEVMERT